MRIYTEEERRASGERLAKARAAKVLKREAAVPEEVQGNGVLHEPTVDFPRLCEMLRELGVDWFSQNLSGEQLRDFCLLLQSVTEIAGRRLQHLETERSAQYCAAPGCGKILPGGRFAGEIIIRDALTNELIPLRACSEPCYREVGRIANERRQRGSGHIRGSVAI